MRSIFDENISGRGFSQRFVRFEAEIYISRYFSVYILHIVQSKVLCTSQVAEHVLNIVPMPSSGFLAESGEEISCKRVYESYIWPYMSRQVYERFDCCEVFGV